jgi:hypothetical protein
MESKRKKSPRINTRLCPNFDVNARRPVELPSPALSGIATFARPPTLQFRARSLPFITRIAGDSGNQLIRLRSRKAGVEALIPVRLDWCPWEKEVWKLVSSLAWSKLEKEAHSGQLLKLRWRTRVPLAIRAGWQACSSRSGAYLPLPTFLGFAPTAQPQPAESPSALPLRPGRGAGPGPRGRAFGLPAHLQHPGRGARSCDTSAGGAAALPHRRTSPALSGSKAKNHPPPKCG